MSFLKTKLKNKIPEKYLGLVPSAFDVVGDIAIFNKVDEKLKKHEKVMAKALMESNKNIKTVCKKVGKFSGRFRTQKLKIIYGEKRKETTHKENNCLFKLNVEKCYFSSRSGNERLRIAKLVKNNETVLVMFSGIGVFPIVIAKNSKVKKVIGIELNKIAYKYGLENLKLNKVNNVELVYGDVKIILPKIKEKFDRIVMPLPKDSEDYLNLALSKLKKNGAVQLYLFCEEGKFDSLINKYKKKFKNVELVKAGVFSPRVYRVCLDLKK